MINPNLRIEASAYGRFVETEITGVVCDTFVLQYWDSWRDACQGYPPNKTSHPEKVIGKKWIKVHRHPDYEREVDGPKYGDSFGW